MALQEHLRMPEGTDALYPKLTMILRSRAWIRGSPEQPDGIASFVKLPDVAFAAERTLAERELRPAISRIVGKVWDAKLQGWSAADGQSVPLAQILEMLESVAQTPSDAHMILDLLTGLSSPAATPIVARLMRGDLPKQIRFRPFKGVRGVLLRNVGSPPYREAERSYEGCLVSFEGPGWPTEWRIGQLNAVGL